MILITVVVRRVSEKGKPQACYISQGALNAPTLKIHEHHEYDH